MNHLGVMILSVDPKTKIVWNSTQRIDITDSSIIFDIDTPKNKYFFRIPKEVFVYNNIVVMSIDDKFYAIKDKVISEISRFDFLTGKYFVLKPYKSYEK